MTKFIIIQVLTYIDYQPGFQNYVSIQNPSHHLVSQGEKDKDTTSHLFTTQRQYSKTLFYNSIAFKL